MHESYEHEQLIYDHSAIINTQTNRLPFLSGRAKKEMLIINAMFFCWGKVNTSSKKGTMSHLDRCSVKCGQ
jgi:hypothetical protein